MPGPFPPEPTKCKRRWGLGPSPRTRPRPCPRVLDSLLVHPPPGGPWAQPQHLRLWGEGPVGTCEPQAGPGALHLGAWGGGGSKSKHTHSARMPACAGLGAPFHSRSHSASRQAPCPPLCSPGNRGAGPRAACPGLPGTRPLTGPRNQTHVPQSGGRKFEIKGLAGLFPGLCPWHIDGHTVPVARSVLIRTPVRLDWGPPD